MKFPLAAGFKLLKKKECPIFNVGSLAAVGFSYHPNAPVSRAISISKNKDPIIMPDTINNFFIIQYNK